VREKYCWVAGLGWLKPTSEQSEPLFLFHYLNPLGKGQKVESFNRSEVNLSASLLVVSVLSKRAFPKLRWRSRNFALAYAAKHPRAGRSMAARRAACAGACSREMNEWKGNWTDWPENSKPETRKRRLRTARSAVGNDASCASTPACVRVSAHTQVLTGTLFPFFNSLRLDGCLSRVMLQWDCNVPIVYKIRGFRWSQQVRGLQIWV